MAGGQEGSPNYMEFIHESGRREIVGKCARYMLKRSQVARLHTGTGGGYGRAEPDHRLPRKPHLDAD